MRKQRAIAQSNEYKKTLSEARERREKYIQMGVSAENEIARLKAELAAYKPQEPAQVADMPGYGEQEESLRAAIQEAERVVSQMAGESAAIRAEITGKVGEIRKQIQEVDIELGKAGALNHAKARIEELREEAKKTAYAMEEIDRKLFLCEEFSRFKAKYIEEGVKLFQDQVNGGLADCCEPTYGGVPYGSLNNGMRINLGVDVIRTISRHYSDRDLVRIEPHVYRPQQVGVNGLDSIVKLLKKELELFESVPLFIRVDGARKVSVFSSLDRYMRRDSLYEASCDVPGFTDGFRDHEKAIIELRSKFAPSSGVEYLLDLISRISKENGVTTKDNGVSQEVEARTGISLKQMVQIKPRVSMRPYRTFLEVEQPESEFNAVSGVI